jgi:hypothetical protein
LKDVAEDVEVDVEHPVVVVEASEAEVVVDSVEIVEVVVRSWTSIPK